VCNSKFLCKFVKLILNLFINMKKINYFLMLCVLAIATILGGCKKEKEEDPAGTVIVFMRNGTNAEPTYVQPQDCDVPFFIDKDDNFNSHDERWRFKVIGNVETEWNISLSKIKTHGGLNHEDLAKVPDPDEGHDWPTKVAVIPKYGYVGVCNSKDDPNKRTFVRIYVTRWVLNAATNGIIGAEVRYQSPLGYGNK
jgi:hypothetical protein